MRSSNICNGRWNRARPTSWWWNSTMWQWPSRPSGAELRSGARAKLGDAHQAAARMARGAWSISFLGVAAARRTPRGIARWSTCQATGGCCLRTGLPPRDPARPRSTSPAAVSSAAWRRTSSPVGMQCRGLDMRRAAPPCRWLQSPTAAQRRRGGWAARAPVPRPQARA